MSQPLSQQQNVSLLNHIKKRNKTSRTFLSTSEAELALEEVRTKVADPHDTYDSNVDGMHEQVFAAFMSEDYMKDYRSSGSTFSSFHSHENAPN